MERRLDFSFPYPVSSPRSFPFCVKEKENGDETGLRREAETNIYVKMKQVNCVKENEDVQKDWIWKWKTR